MKKQEKQEIEKLKSILQDTAIKRRIEALRLCDLSECRVISDNIWELIDAVHDSVCGLHPSEKEMEHANSLVAVLGTCIEDLRDKLAYMDEHGAYYKYSEKPSE